MARRKRKAQQVPEGFELRYSLPTGPDDAGERTPVTGIEWHPDGDTFALLAEHEMWFGNHADSVITDAITFEEDFFSFAWAPDGDTIAASTRQNILLLDYHQREELSDRLSTGRNEISWHIAWSPVSNLLACLSHVVRVWDIQSRQLLQTFRIRRDKADCVAWSPDGERIAWATDAVHIHFAKTGELWQCLDRDELQGACSVAWSPDANILAIGCANPRRVLLWDLAANDVTTLDSDDGQAGGRLHFSPDGRLLAVPSWYRDRVQIWSIADAKLFASINAKLDPHGEPFTFHPTEPALAVVAASAPEGDLVEVWSYDDSAIAGEPYVRSVKPAVGVKTEPKREPSPTQFDVFLCHNSKDKSVVKDIALQLKQRGLRPWLDEWQLRPGLPWQRALEQQIDSIGAAAVFVGPDGMGPWQQMEQEAFLREFVNRGCPVIPVILPGVQKQPDLPKFLKGMTWVDFRRSSPAPLDQLIWGITGVNPNP